MYVFWEEGVTKEGEGKESRKWGRAVWILGIFEYSIVYLFVVCGGKKKEGRKNERKKRSFCGEKEERGGESYL
jgi:hypothetical protein